MPLSPKWSLPFRFPDQNFVCVSHGHMHATCPAHLIHLDLITLVVFREAYVLRSFSFCSVLQPPTTSSCLDSDILHNSLFSNTLNLAVRDYASQSYRKMGCIFQSYKILDRRWEDKKF
jgi:hypothetical protein